MMTEIWLVSYIMLWVLVLIMLVILAGALRHIGLLYERYSRGTTAITKLRAGEMLPDVRIEVSVQVPPSQSAQIRPKLLALRAKYELNCLDLSRFRVARMSARGGGLNAYYFLNRDDEGT